MDQQKFSEYFNNASFLDVPGRLFPVEIIYNRSAENSKRIEKKSVMQETPKCSSNAAEQELMETNKKGETSDTTVLKAEQEVRQHYFDAAKEKVMEIHKKDEPGDILVFMTGQGDIEKLCGKLNDEAQILSTLEQQMAIYALYSALEPDQQAKVFKKAPANTRKVIVATNIAESSVTINGIAFVIDSGLVMKKVYNPKSGIDAYKQKIISRAQAVQRAGRAGRTAPGKCFRLYTEETFNELKPLSPPEIEYSNLASLVLTLKSLGLKSVLDFPFMTMPPEDAIEKALCYLRQIEALDVDESITKLGKQMSTFPLEPSLAKYLTVSAEMGCSSEVLSIASLFSVQNTQRIFRLPKFAELKAKQKHKEFICPKGDHLTLLKVYDSWKENGYSRTWCWENYLSFDVLSSARDIRDQLKSLMHQLYLPIKSCNEKLEVVRRATCAAFFYNAACKHHCAREMTREDKNRKGRQKYKTLKGNHIAYLRPECHLTSVDPEWIVFNELVETQKKFMLQVTTIRREWLDEFAPQLSKHIGGNGELAPIKSKPDPFAQLLEDLKKRLIF